MTRFTRRLALRAAAGQEESSSPEEQASTARTERFPSPTACRKLAHRRMARSMPKIVEVLGNKAEQGSVPHTNLLAKLGGFDRRAIAEPKKRRGKSLAQRLYEQIEEHEAKMMAQNEARRAAEEAVKNANQ